MSIINYKFFQLDENEYAIFPVGNHVNKYIFLTNRVGKEICEYSMEHNKEEIADYLSKKYSISKDILIKDVNDFMKTLIRVTKDKISELDQGWKEQESIQRRIMDSYYRRQLPYNVFIELTYNCNLRCPHCYIQDSLTETKKFIDKEKVFEVLDDLEKLNTVNVFFTGGEAALHPNLIEILKYAASKNLLITLLTNGLLLTEKLLEEIKDIPLYEIQLSLYGKEKEHDSFVKKQGAFQKVNEVLLYLQKEKGLGRAAYSVTEENCDSFSEVFQEFQSKSIPVGVTAAITPTAEGNRKPIEFRVKEKEKLKKIYRQANLSLAGSLCNAGVCRFRISPDGVVNPCEMMHHIVFGNVFQNKFSDILQSKERMDWIAYFEDLKKNCTCSKCEKRRFCSYCPGVFYQEMGSFETPSPYFCFLGELKQEMVKEQKENEGE